MKLFRYLLINSLFVVCLYLGLYEEIEGFKNISIFYCWLAFIASVLALVMTTEKNMKACSKKYTPRPIAKWFDVSFDLLVTCTLIYYGFIFTGIAYLLHIAFIDYYHEQMEKQNEIT